MKQKTTKTGRRLRALFRLGLILALLLPLLALPSCAPQQRLARLERRHPELFPRDTVYRVDTIHVKEVHADTAFRFSHSRDTVVLDKGRLQLKYFYTHDSVYLSGHCRDSVIIRSVPYTVTRLVPPKTGFPWLPFLLGCLAVTLLWVVVRR